MRYLTGGYSELFAPDPGLEDSSPGREQGFHIPVSGEGSRSARTVGSSAFLQKGNESHHRVLTHNAGHIW